MIRGTMHWGDDASEPADVKVWSCGQHIHLTVQCPLTPELGYSLTLNADEACRLASTIVNGLDVPRDENADIDNSHIYIA